MSAKGRAVVDPLEFYATPDHAIAPVMRFVSSPARVLDLGCGTGAIGQVLRSHFQDSAIVGVELDAARATVARDHSKVYDRVVLGDVIAPLTSPLPDLGRAFDLVIANPPFSHAVEFLDVARRQLRFGGTIAFLLRVGWCVPEDRADVVPAGRVPPCDLIMLRKRAFGDATDYAWHIFKPSDPLHGGRFMVL